MILCSVSYLCLSNYILSSSFYFVLLDCYSWYQSFWRDAASSILISGRISQFILCFTCPVHFRLILHVHWSTTFLHPSSTLLAMCPPHWCFKVFTLYNIHLEFGYWSHVVDPIPVPSWISKHCSYPGRVYILPYYLSPTFCKRTRGLEAHSGQKAVFFKVFWHIRPSP